MTIFFNITRLSTIGFIALYTTHTALADEASPWTLFHGAPKYKDADGNYMKLRGRIFWDVARLNETPIGGTRRNIDADEFRTARVGVEGQYKKFKYVGEIDFAGGKTTYKDVNITYKGPIAIKVGQMKTSNSMEEQTSSRHISFIERGMVTDALGLDRRLGVILSKSGKNYSASAGVFGNSINGAQNGAPTNTVWSARTTYAPIMDKNRIVHFGASLRHTDKDAGTPKRSARWGSHLATEKIKPRIGGDALFIGLEAAAIMGPFHAHAEHMQESGNIGSAKGSFIQAGYFLTGESRTYKASAGKFDRTKPSRPLSKGGYGALELLARFDILDARKAGDEKANAYTLGATWYPESHLRVKINYTDTSADTFGANGLYMRVQMDW